MTKNKIYSTLKINKIEDIDTLISTIETKGNFHLEDYNSCLRKAKRSSQPERIRRRLEKVVRPLITQLNFDYLNEKHNITTNNEKDFWNKDYKASDFAVSDGKISLGKYYLKSKRIHKIHPSWLKNIEHIFHIAPEYNENGEIIPYRFHYVPYTDLSYLLEDVEKQIEVQNRRKAIEKVYKEWKCNLFNYLHMHHNFNGIKTHSVKGVFNMMNIQIDNDLYTEMLFYNSNDKKPNICIPMSDVSVVDGKISVLTKNACFTLQPYNYTKKEHSYLWNRHDNDIWTQESFTLPDESGYKTNPSWDGFLEILLKKYDLSKIKESIDDFKEKYCKDTFFLLQSIKDLKSVSFDTFQSKKGFFQRNKEEYLYLFLDNNLKLWYPFQYYRRTPPNHYSPIFDYDIWLQKNLFISDEFEYSTTSLKEIANIIDNNWKLVKDSASWLISDKIPTKHKIGNTINTNRSLRIITEYYESRLEIPYNCKHNIVTFFTENTNHYSDDWWNKCPDNHRTFMVWSGGNTIKLYPSNTDYANYTFFVDTANNSLEVASYVIWRYFTSNLKNKRQYFQPTPLFKLFGIYLLHKK